MIGSERDGWLNYSLGENFLAHFASVWITFWFAYVSNRFNGDPFPTNRILSICEQSTQGHHRDIPVDDRKFIEMRFQNFKPDKIHARDSAKVHTFM